MGDPVEQFQRRITRHLLDALDGTGFALAGAGAIRAHGLTDRPTHDIDLFVRPQISGSAFRAAVTQGCTALSRSGCVVVVVQESDAFARLRVHDAELAVEVDFAVNWRADPPVVMNVGLVLSERDAVAGKLSAVYSRGEVRDFLDLDAIRGSGRYSDADLLALGREHDDGFDVLMFAAQLARVAHFEAEEADEYGVDQAAFALIQRRTLSWAVAIRDSPR